MVKLNRLLRLAAISWFTISTLFIACYAQDEQAAEADEPADQAVIPSTAHAPPEATESIDIYKEIVERPLFSETRRPPDPVTEPVAPTLPTRATPAARADVVLLGIVITPDSRRAVLRSVSEKQADFKSLGDDVNGWQLDAIEPRKVRLTRGTEEKVLELERKAAPQSKPTKRVASRRRSAAAGTPEVDPAATSPAKAAASDAEPNRTARRPASNADTE